jgi:steroid 5-alpha reductase family enzyme
MDWSSLGVITLASLAALAGLQLATWVWSRRAGKWAVVDVAWGAGFAVVGLVSALVGWLDQGSIGLRTLILTALVCVWGGRLSWHIYTRSRGKGEDPRYEDLTEGLGPLPAALKVFGLQGALQWVISLPLQAAAAAQATEGPWALLLIAGVLVFAVGLAFEAVGDAQLAAFKADPDHEGQVMDRGLWAWTRHPNYFGDACVWWGMFLVACSAATWGVAWTVLSPALMTHFLRNVSGAKLLEKSMKDRPAFQEYMKRTAYFFPRPPRR